MSDVRLTALNPDDSSPVPVACDAAGKLLLEDVPAFDGNLDGNLNVTGFSTFGGTLTSSPSGAAYAYQVNNGATNLGGLYKDTSGSRLLLGDGSTTKIDLEGSDGSVQFAGNASFGSEAKLYTYTDSTYSGIYNGSALVSQEAVYMGGDKIFFYAKGTEALNLSDFSAFFAGRIGAGGVATTGGSLDYGLTANANVGDVSNTSAVFARNFNSAGRVWAGVSSAGVTTSQIYGNGSATYSGNVTAPNVTFNLEPDDPDNYITTTETYTDTEVVDLPGGRTVSREVEKTREVNTYSGPILDLKATILDLRDRIEELEKVVQQ
tara:strand:+ start:166 stop:1125 length:960 start_codon:yes stop_codon:yes gene_type:complete